MDWPVAALLQVLPLALPYEGHFPAITNPQMTMGYPLIPPSWIEPFAGGVGAIGAAVVIVAVTPMVLAPLGEAEEKGWIFEQDPDS